MALNIKNAEVERLAAEVAHLAGETRTEAVRRALAERRERLVHRGSQTRQQRILRFLENEVWPNVPPEVLGKRLPRDEEDALLGYGPEGV